MTLVYCGSLGKVSSSDAGRLFSEFLRGSVRSMIWEVIAAEMTELCGQKHAPGDGAPTGTVLVFGGGSNHPLTACVTIVSETLGRNYGTIKTHLHRAGRLGLLECVPRRGWLPVRIE